MNNHNDKRKNGWAMSALFFALGISTPLLAADSYLDALDAEAKNLDAAPSASSPTAAPAPAKSDWTHEQHSISGQLKSGLSQPDFEEQLKSSYFGSYLFYSKLSGTDKESVYREYLKENDIEKLRELIKAKLTQ